jgi:hypothetical protein
MERMEQACPEPDGLMMERNPDIVWFWNTANRDREMSEGFEKYDIVRLRTSN